MISFIHTNTDELSDSEGSIDTVALRDAEAYEILCGSTSANFNPSTVDDALEDATQQTDQTEHDTRLNTADHETASGLIIDHLPFGSPDAPTPRKDRGLSASETLREAQADNPWAPFTSKVDWDVAQWAKKPGRTSKQVTGLLAIPGVRISYSRDTMDLNRK